MGTQAAFVRDLADDRRLIQEIASSQPGRPLRVRVQPQLLRDGQYRTWKDVRWMLDCDTPADALAARDAMRLFFQRLTDIGPKAVIAALTPRRARRRTGA